MAANAELGNTAAIGLQPAGGVGNGNSAASGSVQLAYTGSNWNLTGLYTTNNRGVNIVGTPFAAAAVKGSYNGTNAFNLAGYWQPIQSGWVPSISAGWGIAASNNVGGSRDESTDANITSQSWMVGLNWQDAFANGNVLGMAVGQGTFATSGSDDLNTHDGNYVWEWYYKLQVSKNIAVTPALFYLSRPQGQATGNGNSFESFGALVQTTFRF